MNPTEFVSALSGLKFENVFNPYSDRCLVHDISDAPVHRAQALLDLLHAATKAEVDALWVGRDLGYRGGRRTGLALTDDVHLEVHAKRWSVSVQRATTGSIVAERTAAIIWRVLGFVSSPVFLWNVFPLHPHEADDPFTNRAHGPQERAFGEELLVELIGMLQPRRLVAIGNDAAKAASHLNEMVEVVKVRHPSYGGQRDFITQICHAYDLRALPEQLTFTVNHNLLGKPRGRDPV